MARQIRSFTVTIPANTPETALYSADISFPPMVVTEIDIRVPPGPRGKMGFAIGSAGQPVLPYEAGQFIVADDEKIAWPLAGLWDSGSWQLFGYNTGVYDHSVYVTFLLDLVNQTQNPVTPALSSASISSSGSASSSALPVVAGVLSTTVAPVPVIGPPAAPL